MAEVLGYSEWRNFEKVIEKAKVSIVNSGESVENHFVDVNKMVEVGSNTMRPIKDARLSRYTCYIISQNGNPAKNEIALAQSYFAQQTRRQELAARHIGVEHLKNNDEIRKSLVNRGIKLEELPPEEDIKKVERRIKSRKKQPVLQRDTASYPTDDFPPSIGKVAARELIANGIKDIATAARYTEKELLSIHGVGPKAIRILKEELEKRNLRFKD